MPFSNLFPLFTAYPTPVCFISNYFAKSGTDFRNTYDFMHIFSIGWIAVFKTKNHVIPTLFKTLPLPAISAIQKNIPHIIRNANYNKCAKVHLIDEIRHIKYSLT